MQSIDQRPAMAASKEDGHVLIAGWRLRLIVVVALGAACWSARADFTPLLAPSQSDSPGGDSATQVTIEHDGVALPLGTVAIPPWSSLPPPTGHIDPNPQLDEPGRTVNLPGGPDSATLLLPALLGFGAWQIGRSARKLHFGQVPDWYNEHATQVGHATPLSLEFSRAAMPLCIFDAPVIVTRISCLFKRLGDELYKRLLSQTILLTADPRGPPPTPAC
jgi:hypothetical protein